MKRNPFNQLHINKSLAAILTTPIHLRDRNSATEIFANQPQVLAFGNGYAAAILHQQIQLGKGGRTRSPGTWDVVVLLYACGSDFGWGWGALAPCCTKKDDDGKICEDPFGMLEGGMVIFCIAMKLEYFGIVTDANIRQLRRSTFCCLGQGSFET